MTACASTAALDPALCLTLTCIPQDTRQVGQASDGIVELQQTELVSQADRQNLGQTATDPGRVGKIPRHVGIGLAQLWQ